ncbi:synaptic vesicular amine transporter-like [Patiria miniata]|uniref:Major facilitator superfamily (MFS) profile domain-containing protein n=1 Tax=Patiria miniata TaxID=46514 RepID=A0A914B513_PATMI|nr:synaptic vesicular amine transporter-like [Patiria miniata]XP_038071033.1 synaptic vesicular amine transporter-like [Patiria miniata]XP_038071034.1 synaptic vesicular amine transporter-like [Patiria miniata]
MMDSEKQVSVPVYENFRASLHYRWRDFSAMECIRNLRQSRRLVLFIVFVALLLDNTLMTVVVPILPDYIFAQEHPEYVNGRLMSEYNRSNCTQLPTEHLSSMDTADPMWIDECNVNGTSATMSPEEKLEYRLLLRHANLKVGILFASKAIVQLITNPFVGPLTNRVGYSIPMFTGFVIMFVSTLVFAFGQSYWLLIVARMIQGIGSSCSSVAGMGMLAQRYPGYEERGAAMGIALAGLAFGVLIGPPFGGAMYQFVGKESAFLVLAALALADGFLQLLVLNPGINKETEMEGTSLLTLLRDPYILVAAGAITFGNMGIALLEPSLPLWMLDRMHNPSNWEIGAIFIPSSISYLISTNIFGPLGHKIGRWLSSLLGMVLAGLAILVIPFAKELGHLVVPNFALGFAIGMVDATILPIMGHLVDIRHVSVYGSIYAIADVAFCIGFAVGPSLSAAIVQAVGFTWLLRIVAILSFLYAPLCYFLRDPPRREDKLGILMEERLPVSYTTHKQTDYQTMEEDETQRE